MCKGHYNLLIVQRHMEGDISVSHIVWKQIFVKEGSLPPSNFFPLSCDTLPIIWYCWRCVLHKDDKLLLSYRFRCPRRQWQELPNLTIKLWTIIGEVSIFIWVLHSSVYQNPRHTNVLVSKFKIFWLLFLKL